MKNKDLPLYQRIMTKLPALGILFFLMLISISPIDFGIFKDARPMWLFVAVFYWSLFHPQFLNIFSLFLIGIFYDAFAPTPFGLSAFIFIGMRFIIDMQRKVLLNQPFWTVWLVFASLAFGAGLIMYLIQMLASWHLMSPAPWIVDITLTIIIFPIIASLLKPAMSIGDTL